MINSKFIKVWRGWYYFNLRSEMCPISAAVYATLYTVAPATWLALGVTVAIILGATAGSYFSTR